MKMLRAFAAGALLIGLAALPQPAEAASILMCREAPAVNAAGPGVFKAPNSGTLYSLDNAGCAVAALADIGDFAAGGFIQLGPVRAQVFNTGVATGTTDFVIATLPPSAYIQQIIVTNSVAAAVTGGIAVGSTANGTDIVTAQACAASCVTYVTDANTKLRVFSTTAQQPIHAAAVTAWNSANVTFTVVYGYF